MKLLPSILLAQTPPTPEVSTAYEGTKEHLINNPKSFVTPCASVALMAWLSYILHSSAQLLKGVTQLGHFWVAVSPNTGAESCGEKKISCLQLLEGTATRIDVHSSVFAH